MVGRTRKTDPREKERDQNPPTQTDPRTSSSWKRMQPSKKARQIAGHRAMEQLMYLGTEE